MGRLAIAAAGLAALLVFGTGVAQAVSPGGGWRDPMPGTVVTAGFLANNCGYGGYGSYIDGAYHLGTDMAAPGGANASNGRPVYAIGAGVVQRSVYTDTFGAGNGVVFIRHTAGDGTAFIAEYGHLRGIPAQGATVSAGQQIGTVGPYIYGAHLHFGILPGTAIPANNWGTMPCSSWPGRNGFANPMTWLAANPAAPPPPPVPAAGSPFGNLELVKGVNSGYVAVRGWTMDPDAKSTPTRIHVYVEDSNIGSAIANIDRPDVERVHGGGRAHGFSAALKLAPGRHTVRVYAINVPDTPGSNPMLDSATITVPEPVPGAPFGNFESAQGLLGGRAEVIGWTVDPNARSGSTGVHAYIDGPSGSGFRGVDVGTANRVRNDVARVHDGGGLHGFRATISGLTPGWHSIWIYGINVSGTPGNNPLIEVVKVNVPPGDAPPAVVTPPTPGTQTPPGTTGSGGTPGTTGGTGTTGTTGDNGTTTKPARCRVPRLAGKTVPNARTAIARSGCRLGRITYVGRANRRADRVVKSNRRAGVSLPARTKVNLVVRR